MVVLRNTALALAKDAYAPHSSSCSALAVGTKAPPEPAWVPAASLRRAPEGNAPGRLFGLGSPHDHYGQTFFLGRGQLRLGEFHTQSVGVPHLD